MDAARRGKWIGFLCLGVTAFGWALMKLLLQQWPPLFARGLAGVAAALILFGIAKARGQPLEVPREAVPRHRVSLPMPPLVVVAWQVGLGCLAMLILGVAFEQPNYGALTAQGLACFIYMTLVPMGVCYLTWFETLRRLPPSSASTGMLLVPLIGVISAALILGEPLGLREVVAMVLTLGGVTLALQKA
jgi:drug/metabolite transporter (DMT)-like permease